MKINKKYATKLSKSNNLTCASEMLVCFESETLLDPMLVISTSNRMVSRATNDKFDEW